jgi:hypothetical protein
MTTLIENIAEYLYDTYRKSRGSFDKYGHLMPDWRTLTKRTLYRDTVTAWTDLAEKVLDRCGLWAADENGTSCTSAFMKCKVCGDMVSGMVTDMREHVESHSDVARTWTWAEVEDEYESQ